MAAFDDVGAVPQNLLGSAVTFTLDTSFTWNNVTRRPFPAADFRYQQLLYLHIERDRTVAGNKH